jgi:hypothetical protein
MMENQTICIVMRGGEKFTVERDVSFGKRLSIAINDFLKTRKPQSIRSSQYGGMAATVIGVDAPETRHVYVLQEGTGERVSASEGSQSSLDAIAEILRSRGYTCIKRGEPFE